MKNIEIMGLDKDFNIVCYLSYSNLQWRRKWYESGSFSVQIPADQYDDSIKYIYTKDRPEVGEISQVNYIKDEGSYIFALSGYFLEEQLNRRVVYKLGSGNITNGPTWVNQSGAAETVATAFFNAFKDVKYTYNNTAFESILGIEAQASQGRGKNSEHERGEEYLGNKVHTILKPSEMSYRVLYDLDSNKKVFKCVKGHDRTQDNEDDENPVIFSTAYGNLKNPNILISDTDYKNCYISSNRYTEDDVEIVDVQANCERADGDTSDRFLNNDASVNRNDYSTTAEYIAAIHSQGHEKLIECKKKATFEFDALEGSYEYLEDFDIGDKCSLEVPEVGLSKDAVLIECTEVIKKGTWTLTLEFDTDN